MFCDIIAPISKTANYIYSKLGRSIYIYMKVVGYCRLSRDEDKENYASIEEQKIILQDYAMSRGWKILDRDFYIDDNLHYQLHIVLL